MENLTVERTLWINAPRQRVWDAISNPDQLAQWLMPPAMGAQMKHDDSGKIFVTMGPMEIPFAIFEKLDPPRQLTSRGLPDQVIAITYTLEEENGRTHVTLTMSGFESLPADGGRNSIEPSSAAWEKALQNLKAYIEGNELPFPEGYASSLFGYRRETKQKIAVERSIWIAASRQRVWDAITDPAQIEHWFSPGTQWRGTGLKVGGTFSVYNPETDSDMYTQVIEVVNPPHQFVSRSLPETPEGTGYMSDWTLHEEKGGTRLVITYSGYELDAADTRHVGMEQNAFGFGMMLDNVKAVIEGTPLPYPGGF